MFDNWLCIILVLVQKEYQILAYHLGISSSEYCFVLGVHVVIWTHTILLKILHILPLPFEALVVWGVVGCCRGEELGPFVWLMPVAVFSASHQFAEHTSQM